ncbi:MAG: tRNA 2-thiouridine(34) synthase MnmA [Gammaproteobacteria bacterium]|nr:MAG: tRNA 2-thiouridine(34) synthase MnmA [Gammaproteobacteria bacterium]
MATKHIFVGMSGGVDSSVAALLLLEQGYRVSGLFMKNWDEDDTEQYCSAAEDLKDAQAVCDKLGIELHTVNFAAEYWDRVFSQFLDEHKKGRTPNPDTLCNREIKFAAFLDHALTLGADMIATGHYVRRGESDAGWQLLKGSDPGKDQSYFLYMIGQRALNKSLFPVGELEKSAVRERAQRAGFVTARKKDSTGICFIGERPHREFLQQYLKQQPGDMVAPDGSVVGQHEGLAYYTLGQRQGLGIGGPGEPWFVAAKDAKNNILRVVQGHDHADLQSMGLMASELHWVAGEAPALPLRCAAKTRYRQADQACKILAAEEGRVKVVFDSPQRAVTPGQSVVFYQDDVCLGGGVIDTPLTSLK